MKQTLKRSTVIALSFGLVFSFSSTVPALAKDTPPPLSFDSLKHLENFQFKQIQAWAPGHPQLNWQGGLGASRPPAPKPPSKPGDWCKGYGVGITCEAAPPKPPEPDTSAFGDIMSMIQGLGPLLGNLGSSPNPGQTADQLHALALALQSAPNIKRYIEILLQEFKELKIESKQNNQTSLDDAKFIKALELLVNIYRLQASIGDNASELSEPLQKLQEAIANFLLNKINERKEVVKKVLEIRSVASSVSQVSQQLVNLRYVDTNLHNEARQASTLNLEVNKILSEAFQNYNILPDSFWNDLQRLSSQVESLKQLKSVALDVPNLQVELPVERMPFRHINKEIGFPKKSSFRQIKADLQLVSAQDLEQSRKRIADSFSHQASQLLNLIKWEKENRSSLSGLIKKFTQLQEKIDEKVQKAQEELQKQLQKKVRTRRQTPQPSVSAAPASPSTKSPEKLSKEEENLARRILRDNHRVDGKLPQKVWDRVIELNEKAAPLRTAIGDLKSNKSPEAQRLKDTYQRQLDRILKNVSHVATVWFKKNIVHVAIQNLTEELKGLQEKNKQLKKKTMR